MKSAYNGDLLVGVSFRSEGKLGDHFIQSTNNDPTLLTTPVYLDNHATTPVDPRVMEVMLPYFTEIFGNAGSTSHQFGWDAKEAVDNARKQVATAIGASVREIVFTSGATESNNLALRGICERRQTTSGHIISVTTEHKAILDPLRRLDRRGFDVTYLDVSQVGSDCPGWLFAEQVADAIRDDTVLVSVMLANNETGIILPLAEIGAICKERKILLHTDATQAVGKIPIDVDDLQVDLLSMSAHKMYGPKGVGALYVRRKGTLVRLEPQIDGGGQESSMRSGTLNVPGIVGLGKAAELSIECMPEESATLAELRNRLHQGLTGQLSDVELNGPSLDSNRRLPGNLSMSFAYVDGEALMMSMGQLAVSSGSACTSANPEPSHVLRSTGVSDDLTRASLRFGLGRFNTQEEVDFAIKTVTEAVTRLRKLSSMA